MATTTQPSKGSTGPTVISIVRSNYDPNKLYTDSTDSKGHYEQINTKLPPSLEALIARAVDDNPGYQRSRQAFVRDAIVHRLHFLHTNPASTIDPVALELYVWRAQMDADLALDQQIKHDVDKFHEVLEICIASRNWSRLNVYIERLQQMLDEQELAPGHHDLISDAVADAMSAMSDATDTRKRRR